MNQDSITWKALDHIREKKTDDWFWIFGIVSVSMAILSIFFNNILFALLIILATFSAFMLAHSAPKTVEYGVTKKGIKIDNLLYPYSNLESFWMIDEDGYERDRVLIKSKKTFMPFITLPIGKEANMEEIRNVLVQYLKEEELQESFSEYLMHLIGF